jgi:hypothetical protein
LLPSRLEGLIGNQFLGIDDKSLQYVRQANNVIANDGSEVLDNPTWAVKNLWIPGYTGHLYWRRISDRHYGGRYPMPKVIAAFLFLLPVGPAVLAQQPVRATGEDSIRAEIVAQHGRQAAEWLQELRPTSRSVSRARQDQLADSLVKAAAMAAVREDRDPTSVSIADALADAGEPVVVGRLGIPYPGAGDRLVELFRLTPPTAVATRGAALYGLNRVGSIDAILPLLDSIARSQDRLAGVAMDLLVENASPGDRRRASPAQRARALSLLRAIWDQAIGPPTPASANRGPLELRRDALGALYHFGLRQGWQKPGI